MEVLVAMAIFSIVATATGKLMTATTGIVSLNKDYAESVTKAQGQVEKLRAIDYDAIVSGSAEEDADGYTVVWIVSADDPAPGTKTIVVHVTWMYKETQKEYVTQTIFSQVTT
jgi:hypothetical protein